MQIRRCVLLDWDGTVANTLPIWLKVYLAVFKGYGINATINEIFRKAYGDPFGCTKFGIKDVSKFNSKLFGHINEKYYKAPLYKNVVSTLKLLRGGKKCTVSIVTSTKRDMVERAISYHKLSPFIDLLVGREDVLELKPNPKALKPALSKFSCIKERSILIGDSDKDILAAKNTGIKSALFLPKENLKFVNVKELELLKPTYTISSFEEIVDLVND